MTGLLQAEYVPAVTVPTPIQDAAMLYYSTEIAIVI